MLDYLEIVRPGSVPPAIRATVQRSQEAGEPEPQQLQAAINVAAKRRRELLAELENLDRTLTRVFVERATDPDHGADMTQLDLRNEFQITQRALTSYRFDPLELPPPPAA